MKTVIVPEHDIYQASATAWGAQLGLPVMQEDPGGETWLLGVGQALALQPPDRRARPLTVEFAAGAMGYRLRHRRQERVVRAMGKKTLGLRLLDATAGLGQDGFILAEAGFQLTLQERSPLIAALLVDGLRRAALSPTTAAIVDRIEFRQGDSLDWLRGQNGPPFDIIYLDPMYPGRTKARGRQTLELLGAVVAGDNENEAALLSAALEHANRRVVVKRPRHAEDLGGHSPDVRLPGSSTRFDIYVLS